MSNQLLNSMLEQAIKNLDGVAPLINNIKAERDRLAAENKRLRQVMLDAWVDTDWLLIANEVHEDRAALKEKS